MTFEERRGAFMFALGMGYYAWRFAHQPILPVLAMVVGITLGTWASTWLFVWICRRLRWYPITGNAGVVGFMAGPNGVSLGLGRRHLWLWRRQASL